MLLAVRHPAHACAVKMSISHAFKLLGLVLKLFYVHTQIILLLIDWIIFDSLVCFLFELTRAVQLFGLDLYHGLSQFTAFLGSIPETISTIYALVAQFCVVSIEHLDQVYGRISPLLNPYHLTSICTFIGLLVPACYATVKYSVAFARIAFRNNYHREEPAPLEDADADICSICQEHVLQKTLLRRRFATLQGCWHTFCAECIHHWAIEQKMQKCPLCRATFLQYKEHTTLLESMEEKKLLFQNLNHNFMPRLQPSH